MNRPLSPNSIMEIDLPEDTTSLYGISREIINEGASNAFLYIKQKLNKETLTSGEMLLEFWNYDGTDGILFTELFCLAILVIIRTKNELNQIQDNIYSNLMNYTTNMYASKIEQF